MRPLTIIGAIVAVIVIAALVFFIDVDQTQEGEMPEVSIEGGEAPEFDTEVGDIETGSEEVTITVPTVDAQTPEEEAAENN